MKLTSSRMATAVILAVCLPAGASGLPSSALDELRSHRPSVLAELDQDAQALLNRMTPEQLADFKRGVAPEEIELEDGSSLAEFETAKLRGVSLEIRAFTIDGGGRRSSAGSFSLEGTIGQPDADYAAGGHFDLLGGYREDLGTRVSPIFSDGFESGNTASWSITVP